MARIVLYHNPACSKSRGALALLEERDVEFEIIEYLKNPLDEAALAAVLGLIEDAPEELVRKDGNFRELGLAAKDFTTPEAVARLLAQHPKLMQRPVVVRGERALIARPPERVEELL